MTAEGYGLAYQRGYELTVRFLLSRGVHREPAIEVAQAAWVRGWERLSQLRDESLVVTWVNTIALNVYRTWLRREPHQPDSLEVSDKTVSIDLAAIDVARILSFCRPCDRVLLEQAMVGVTAKEMATERGVTETAIRIRLLRARREARMWMEGRVVSRGDGGRALMPARDAA